MRPSVPILLSSFVLDLLCCFRSLLSRDAAVLVRWCRYRGYGQPTWVFAAGRDCRDRETGFERHIWGFFVIVIEQAQCLFGLSLCPWRWLFGEGWNSFDRLLRRQHRSAHSRPLRCWSFFFFFFFFFFFERLMFFLSDQPSFFSSSLIRRRSASLGDEDADRGLTNGGLWCSGRNRRWGRTRARAGRHLMRPRRQVRGRIRHLRVVVVR